MVFYVLKQPRLLIISYELSDDDAVGVRQSAVLDENAAAADGGGHAVKEREGVSDR